ncbi:MAG: hypothetical protein V1896_02275, partial [Candidatus Zambryskibacteria bacterium]
QTDAKISRGSSGGPLLDENGRAIGLVTFITSDLVQQNGDSFAFAIPIDVVISIVKNNKVAGELPRSFDSGTYNKHFLAGLDLLHNNQCKKALAEFDSAKQVNGNFPVAGFLDPYSKQCGGIISAGNSVDTAWELLKIKLSNTRFLILFTAVVALILVGTLTALWFWLFRRVRKDENELDNVEEYMHLNLEDGTPIEGKSHRVDDGSKDDIKTK